MQRSSRNLNLTSCLYLEDELGVGVGVLGVSSPQPTERAPAAIDAAPDKSRRK